MKSLSDPSVLHALIRRLEALSPAMPRRWGTLSPHEMLCHLSDAAEGVLGRPGGPPAQARRWRKWIGLYTPFPWPHGLKTPASVDPRKAGSRPDVFERDRARAIAGLRALAGAADEAFPAAHGYFGAMRAEDWRRWGYCHTDHHLRQFGL